MNNLELADLMKVWLTTPNEHYDGKYSCADLIALAEVALRRDVERRAADQIRDLGGKS